MSQGEVYKKIQYLLTHGGKGDHMAMSYIRSKLMLKGIYPERYGPDTDDPPEVIIILDKFIQNLLGRK